MKNVELCWLLPGLAKRHWVEEGEERPEEYAERRRPFVDDVLLL